MEFRLKIKLSPHLIHPGAYKIIENLQKHGFTTYLVGGSVRDLLLGIQPKDFDISTTAHPYQIKKIISKAYIIGRRFRLVLVKRGQEQFEVSTFRRDAKENELKMKKLFSKKTKAFQHRKNNFFGTPEEDARRRDFTVNALFYDPISCELIDYVGGLGDLREGLIRMIGDPLIRLKEDSVRILRALRLSYKVQFDIDKSLKKAMKKLASSLKFSNLLRKRQEFLKILSLKDPSLPLLEAYDLNILKYTCKNLNKIFSFPESLEVCLSYLKSYHSRFVNKSKAVELFYPLVLAYIRGYEFLEKPSLFFNRSISDFSKMFSPFPFFRSSHFNSSLRSESRRIEENKKEEFFPFEFLLTKKNVRFKELKRSLTVFMKEELGLFQYEQNLFLKALRMVNLLKLNSNFRDKKKKKANPKLYSREVFSLALKIAQRDYIFSAEELSFWSQKYRLSL